MHNHQGCMAAEVLFDGPMINPLKVMNNRIQYNHFGVRFILSTETYHVRGGHGYTRIVEIFNKPIQFIP